MLAKLVSGLHKPDDQTVLFPTEAAGFIRHLPLRAIHGVVRNPPFAALFTCVP